MPSLAVSDNRVALVWAGTKNNAMNVYAAVSEDGGVAITNMEPGKRGTRPYFAVDDIKAGAARVTELGGEAGEPMPVSAMGWFSTCKDPHGNEFGLWQNDTSAA